MPAARTVDAEPIPGYRLLEPLGRGCFGEVWKCEAPGGMPKAIKFVSGKQGREGSRNNAQQELRALEKVKRLRHPFLLSIERVEVVDGNLIVVSELADRSLHDLLLKYRQEGRPGLPRAEALAYLVEAAEVLDFLNLDHGLQHLDIKPRNLFLIGKHVKVADFGLVASLAELDATKDQLGGITPLYAAPEVFEGQPSVASDQYSLAATYTELVCGEPPLRGKNITHLMLLLQTSQRDLGGLIEADRAVVHKALSRDPNLRFGSCLEFVEALAAIEPPADSGAYRLRPRSSSHAGVKPQSGAHVPATTGSGSFATAGSGLSGIANPSGSCQRDSRVQQTVRAAAANCDQLLPGFAFQECISRGPTGELWRALGPGRRSKLVRLIAQPALNGNGEDPLRALRNLRNPQIPPWDIRPAGPGRVALISDAGEYSLATRFKEFQTAGHQGISRTELLAFLGAIAQGLDELYEQTGLQHLGLTPKHLIFQDDEAMMLEFGLSELLWLPADIQPVTMSPRYCAAELHQNQISDACDQYSLALIYAELLVGAHPFHNLNARQLASPHLRAQPDLSLLPSSDCAVIAQALEPDPQKRFRSCVEFMLALENAHNASEQATVTLPSAKTPTRVAGLPAVANAAQKPPASQVSAGWRGTLDEWIGQASRDHQLLTLGELHFRHHPGKNIGCRGATRLTAAQVRLKLAAFRDRWGAETPAESATRWRMTVKHRASLLQRCFGQTVALSIDVVLGTPQAATGQMTPVAIAIAPTDPESGKAGAVLDETGPSLLTSLQSFLSLQNRRDDQERYLVRCQARWEPPHGGAILAQVRHLGRGGATLSLGQPLSPGAGILSVELLSSTAPLRLPGTVEDCVSDGEGNYLVEVAFPR